MAAAPDSAPRFNTFAELADHLDRLGMFRMQLGLSRMEALLERLGLSRPPFAVAHVVGTNGKGSVAACLDALARKHGLRSGLYTSPHFLDFRERALIDGAMLSQSAWLDAANEVQAAGGDLELTYFEFMTAAALLLFRAQGVDLAVMEAGLGGAYDATRALGACLVLMSEVARDHEQVLGPGLDNIARDKAGAFRPSVPAISVPQPAPVEDIFRQCAESLASPLDFSQELPSAFRTALKGRRQRRNAALALDGFQALSGVLDIEVSMAKSREALAKLRLPGRFQLVSGRPEYILDAAHNPAALKALGQTLEQEETPPSAVLFTCLADKALEEMAPLVRAMTSGPMVVPELPGIPRARPAAEVAEALGEGVRTADGAAEALDLLGGERRVLLCGSLFLLAEFFRLRPDCLEIPELGEP